MDKKISIAAKEAHEEAEKQGSRIYGLQQL